MIYRQIFPDLRLKARLELINLISMWRNKFKQKGCSLIPDSMFIFHPHFYSSFALVYSLKFQYKVKEYEIQNLRDLTVV